MANPTKNLRHSLLRVSCNRRRKILLGNYSSGVWGDEQMTGGDQKATDGKDLEEEGKGETGVGGGPLRQEFKKKRYLHPLRTRTVRA